MTSFPSPEERQEMSHRELFNVFEKLYEEGKDEPEEDCDF